MERDRTSLEIREVFPEDAGTYVVIAKNLGGESRTSCLLSIEGAAIINGELPLTGAAPPARPIFIQPLQNKEVQEGSRAHLMCVVSGQPKPEVSFGAYLTLLYFRGRQAIAQRRGSISSV